METTKKTETSDDENVNTNNDDNHKFLDMYNEIYRMRRDLEGTKKPVGTRDNPVRTCRDLYYGHPQFNDGIY